VHIALQTRWGDNDSYGHVNNVVYLAFFDSAVNRYLIDHKVLDVKSSSAIALVVENQCSYFSSVSFPDTISVGLRVETLGSSSVQYNIAVFRDGADLASARGRFVHVYVDRTSHRPTAIPQETRALLEKLMVQSP
jgi:acyl-CoA thioester hydrolase